jgi:uncharacterized membrane protein YozB (DUF420 family)
MPGFLNQPGFLGTHATLRADLSLTLIVVSAILFTTGWQLAVHKKFDVHQIIQNLAVALNALVVALAMVGVFIQQYLPAIQDNPGNKTLILVAMHAITGALGLLYGIYVAACGNGHIPKKLRFRNFKTIMRVAYGLYMVITAGGVILYLNLYG